MLAATSINVTSADPIPTDNSNDAIAEAVEEDILTVLDAIADEVPVPIVSIAIRAATGTARMLGEAKAASDHAQELIEDIQPLALNLAKRFRTTQMEEEIETQYRVDLKQFAIELQKIQEILLPMLSQNFVQRLFLRVANTTKIRRCREQFNVKVEGTIATSAMDIKDIVLDIRKNVDRTTKALNLQNENPAQKRFYCALQQKLGSDREEDPWRKLRTVEVQEVADDVWGNGQVMIKKGGRMEEFASGHLDEWRFYRTAADNVETFLERETSLDPARVRETVAEMLEWIPIRGEQKTRKFSWKTWNMETSEDGNDMTLKRTGRLQSSLVLHTLARAHFYLHQIPLNFPQTDESLVPVGALILAVQAVEHALRTWESGTLAKNPDPASQFSRERYGDRYEPDPKAPKSKGKGKMVLTEREATRRLNTIKAFDVKTWTDIFETMASVLPSQQSKREKAEAVAAAEHDLPLATQSAEKSGVDVLQSDR